MPIPENHLASIDVSAPALGGIFSIFVSSHFGISPDTLLAALAGCWIGIAARPKSEPTSAPRSAMMLWLDKLHLNVLADFLGVLITVTVCTVATAYLAPIVLQQFPDVAQNSAAAGLGFLLVMFQRQIIGHFSEILQHVKDAIVRRIGRF